ncbi:MAG: hypothetical protein CUN57_01870, partial [Phototrophicales bacterium]
MAALATALYLGAMFGRSSVMFNIFSTFKQKHNLSGKVNSLLITGVAVLIVLIVQIIILTVWTVVDPYKMDLESKYAFSLKKVYGCTMNTPYIWSVIELVFVGGLLVWGAFVIFATWSLKRSMVTTRWMLIHVYNVIM